MNEFTLKVLALCLLAPCWGFGHGVGRLFDIAVVDGKLVAQGYNTGGFDGGETVRPYVNSIHDHFNFIISDGQPLGVTDYPSWDVGILPGSNISELIGFGLNVELIGSGKWINVPAQDGTGLAQDFGKPELMFFSNQFLLINPAEIIRVSFGGDTINTLNLGGFQFSDEVTGPIADLDFKFFIDQHNATEIYFVQFRLTTNAPGVEDSDSIYVIQSPDGIGPVERMHFQSLYLERYFGNVDPKPVLGDVNLDGRVDLLDVEAFVNRIQTNVFQAEADVNQDGVVNLFDVQPFVVLVSG